MLDKNLLYKESMKNLSSFYRDYMVDDKLLKTLTVAYMHSLDMLTNYTNDIFVPTSAIIAVAERPLIPGIV